MSKCEGCQKYADCSSGSGLTWPCGAYVPAVADKRGNSMTHEEAIKYLTPIVESASLPGYKAALGLALEALRGCALCIAVCRPAESAPAPLTAEELLLMEGEPVYCISDYEITVNGEKGHRFHAEGWGIVTGTDLGDQGFIVGTAYIYHLEHYGKTWMAYRRKPEEGKCGDDV